MMQIKIGTAFLVVWLAVAVWGCGDSDDVPVPSFANDILPILTQRCALSGCHVAGGPHGVDLRTYETLQKGGEHGPIVVAGNAGESELVEEIVEGNMPLGGPRLKTEQIQLIIDWVNSGAKND